MRKISNLTDCRSSKELSPGCQWHPRVYSTANPGGIGHPWYKSAFLAAPQPGVALAATFIPSRLSDNHFTNNGSNRVTQRLSGWQRRAWFDVDSDVAAGQYFLSLHTLIHTFHSLDAAKVAFWTAALD